MTSWFLRRLLITGITFLGFTMLVFILMRLAPVSPVDMLLFNLRQQGGLPAQDVQALHDRLARELGLDQPIPVQYLVWLKEVLTHGSLGFSFVTGRPSLDVVLERMGPTMLLMGTALLIELALAVPLGIIAALHRNRWTDYVISSFGLSVVAVPSFFLALAAIFVFSAELGILPSGGLSTPTKKGLDFIDVGRHLLMPALVLGLSGVGPVLRYVRTSIVETLGQEFLVTARGKGLSVNQTVLRHAFPNALLPVITVIGLQVGTLLSGAFITESVFSWPGMGSLGLQSIFSKDYPVIQAFAIVTGATVLLGNVLADFAYGLADPRIRVD